MRIFWNGGDERGTEHEKVYDQILRIGYGGYDDGFAGVPCPGCGGDGRNESCM